MKYFSQSFTGWLLIFMIGVGNSCKKEEVPTVVTSAVNTIDATNAVCGGEITNEGSGTVTERGVCWSDRTNPTIGDNRTDDGAGAGTFISNMIDLKPATTYYVKAYARNEAGIGYGMTMSFKTLEQLYIGTWQFKENITVENLVYNTTRTLILMHNTYEETYVIQEENSSNILSIIGTKGDLEITPTGLFLP